MSIRRCSYSEENADFNYEVIPDDLDEDSPPSCAMSFSSHHAIHLSEAKQQFCYVLEGFDLETPLVILRSKRQTW